MSFNYDKANQLLSDGQYGYLAQMIQEYQLMTDPEEQEDVLCCLSVDYTNLEQVIAFFRLAEPKYDFTFFLEVFGDYIGESQLPYPELFRTIKCVLKAAIDVGLKDVEESLRYYDDELYEANYDDEQRMVSMFKATQGLEEWQASEFIQAFERDLSKDHFTRISLNETRVGQMSTERKLANIEATLQAAIKTGKVDIVAHLAQLKAQLQH